MFKSPCEICFSVFGFDVYCYGLVMAIAVLSGAFFSDFVRKKYFNDVSEKSFFDVLFVALIFGFLGARIYYCLFNFDYYSNHLTDIFNFRQGGLSIHGGLILGVISACLFAYVKKLPVLKLADIFSYGLILAQAIGRWGNFFNSEAFGRPTDIFCKLYIPVSHRPLEYVNFEYFHPAFLYESILDLFIFFILFFVVRKYVKNCYGFVFVSYIFLYSLARIVVESIRIDSVFFIFNIPLPIIASILFLIFSIIFSIILAKKYFKM